MTHATCRISIKLRAHGIGSPHFTLTVIAKREEKKKKMAHFKHLQKARHDFAEASKQALQNRKFLCDLMTEAGFQPLIHEWWHYNLPNGKDADHPMIEWPFERTEK